MADKETKAVVTELLPNNTYKVECEGGVVKLCYLSGKMRLNKIRVLLGDKVRVVLDPYGGKTTNRIVRRD